MTYDSKKYGYDPYVGGEVINGITQLKRPPRKLGCIIDYLTALGEGEGCTEDEDPMLYDGAMSEIETMINQPDKFFAPTPAPLDKSKIDDPYTDLIGEIKIDQGV